MSVETLRFGMVLFPPAVNVDGQWYERMSDLNLETEHSFLEVVEALTCGT